MDLRLFLKKDQLIFRKRNIHFFFISLSMFSFLIIIGCSDDALQIRQGSSIDVSQDSPDLQETPESSDLFCPTCLEVDDNTFSTPKYSSGSTSSTGPT
ncbi:MAG: hypothetical protein OXC44_03460 [Proteobacteria bacterium]|nr:hypothetical protein [Pseudomonadota bacterium]